MKNGCVKIARLCKAERAIPDDTLICGQIGQAGSYVCKCAGYRDFLADSRVGSLQSAALIAAEHSQIVMGVANGGDLTPEADGFGQDSDALGFAQAPGLRCRRCFR